MCNRCNCFITKFPFFSPTSLPSTPQLPRTIDNATQEPLLVPLHARRVLLNLSPCYSLHVVKVTFAQAIISQVHSLVTHLVCFSLIAILFAEFRCNIYFRGYFCTRTNRTKQPECFRAFTTVCFAGLSIGEIYHNVYRALTQPTSECKCLPIII